MNLTIRYTKHSRQCNGLPNPGTPQTSFSLIVDEFNWYTKSKRNWSDWLLIHVWLVNISYCLPFTLAYSPAERLDNKFVFIFTLYWCLLLLYILKSLDLLYTYTYIYIYTNNTPWKMKRIQSKHLHKWNCNFQHLIKFQGSCISLQNGIVC